MESSFSEIGRELGREATAHALPSTLMLQPLSRRPIQLSDTTVQAVLGLALPEAPARDTRSPCVSVVMVSYNNFVFTKLCLASLLANTDYPNYEIIVVDNASTDDTPEFLGALTQRQPRVRVLRNDRNLGFAPAINQGLAAASGEVLVLLNNDTIVTPGWLGRLAGHLVDPAVGAVGPVTNRIGNEAEIEATYDSYGDMLQFAGEYTQARAGRLFEIPMLAMFCLAMRRDVYLRVGPLDERFEVGMLEDDDYAMRLHRAGYRLICAEDVFVHHFGEGSFGKLVATGEYGRLIEANRRRFHEKWGVTWQPHGRRLSSQYRELIERVQRIVDDALPRGAVVLVVSRGDDELLQLGARQGWHFPQDEAGVYAGYNPGDGTAVVAHLEALRARGADFLLFPSTAFWWLGHYKELRHHLEGRYREVARREGTCVIYALREGKGNV